MTRKLHICFVTNEYPTSGKSYGGIGTMVNFLSRAFAEQGHQVSVVGNYAKTGKQSLLEGKLTIYRLAKARGTLAGYFNVKHIGKCIAKVHAENPIDVIEGPEWTFGFLKTPSGVKKVIRLHGGHHFFAHSENRKTEWRKAIMERRSFSNADHFIAVSDFVGKETNRLIDKKFDYTIIHNPIDMEQFYQANTDKKVADRLVFVGSVVEKKGIRQLVQAMPKILTAVPEAELIVVGRHVNLPGTQTPYLPLLKKEISSDIAERIKLKGPVPHTEVVSYIESGEVCVYPSHMEALPLAWLEVLAMGKPFIGSKTGPGAEVVNDGKTGLLCDPHSPDDIAEKVIWMLKHKAEAASIAKEARVDVQKRFDLEVLAKKNLDYFYSITT